MLAGLPHPSLFPITNIKFTALASDAQRDPGNEITIAQDSEVPLAQWLQYGKVQNVFLTRPDKGIKPVSQAAELEMHTCANGVVTSQRAFINRPIQILRFYAIPETRTGGDK